MSQLSLDIPHTLGQAEAARRLKEKIAAADSEYKDSVSDLTHEWRDNSLSFAFEVLGMAVSGVLTVEQECVRLAARLPLAAAMFKGLIEERIRRELGGLLE